MLTGLCSFFFRNWDSIADSAASTGRRAFFLDWLGMGASSRPNPSIIASPVGAPVESRVARAEHFFLSSLESWRASVGVEKMVLVGHSLGGYLASAYALKYPERVSSLILVSPAGIPHGELPADGPGPSRGPTGPGGKQWKDGKPVEGASNDQAADAAEMEMHDPKEGTAPEQAREVSMMRRGVTKFLLWGWEKGMSPFSILRGIGPWGPLLVGKYSSRRFAAQTPEDVRDLHSYIYATSVLKGSGEFCISHLLAPGAFARMPIVDRIHRLRMPVTFLYGDNDWMDVAGGLMSEHILAKEGNTDVQVHVVPGAGHHLYLDNPTFTNKVLEDRIKSAPTMK
jgi:cardiolipin-specific phospholipase